MSHSPVIERQEEAFEAIREAILRIAVSQDPRNQGALKVLHEPTEARDEDRADERLRSEIEAMKGTEHPNLLRILDADDESKWFVSEYHERGPLTRQIDLFTGNAMAALVALRPVVEGLALPHKKGLVHRDVKPDNIFIASDDRLVLGDFGLIFFADPSHNRLSATYENVGSRDWMPPWATGMRIDDIKPNFDVFCLGKILWAMVSNKPILRLWYFDREGFDLTQIFPEKPEMAQLNALLARCVVEEPADCLPDADALLGEIDRTISAISIGAQTSDGVDSTCRVCGRGRYRVLVNEHADKTRNFGLDPAGTGRFRILACEYCGNAQLFYRSSSFVPQSRLDDK